MDWSDTFNISNQWAKQLCREIIERKLDITWKTNIRLNDVDHELAEMMKKAGCWLVSAGIESGNDETLRGTRKSIDIQIVQKSLNILKEHDMKVFGILFYFTSGKKMDN